MSRLDLGYCVMELSLELGGGVARKTLEHGIRLSATRQEYAVSADQDPTLRVDEAIETALAGPSLRLQEEVAVVADRRREEPRERLRCSAFIPAELLHRNRLRELSGSLSGSWPEHLPHGEGNFLESNILAGCADGPPGLSSDYLGFYDEIRCDDHVGKGVETVDLSDVNADVSGGGVAAGGEPESHGGNNGQESMDPCTVHLRPFPRSAKV